MTSANFIAVVLIAMCYENKKPRVDDHDNLIQMAAVFDLHCVDAAQKYSTLKYHRLKVLAGRVVQDCAYTKNQPTAPTLVWIWSVQSVTWEHLKKIFFTLSIFCSCLKR